MYNNILIMLPNTISKTAKKYGGRKLSFTTPLCQITSILNYNKYNVTPMNFIRPKGDFLYDINYIIKNNFDIIFIYTSIPLYKSSLIYAKEIKKYLSKIKIIFIHKFNKEIDDEIFNTNCADIIIHGEEDYTVLDIVSGKDLKDIKGISYRDENGNIIHNEPRPLIDNLDDLPLDRFGYELLPIQYYNKLYIQTNRGCIGNCNFCIVKGGYTRYKSAEMVASEIKYLTNKYSIYNIFFSDLTFTSDKEYTYSLMDAFDKYKINIKWYCQTRVDMVDKELLQSMYDHGCVWIASGAESIDKNILNFTNKGIQLDQLSNIVFLSRKIGIDIKLHFMMGFPGETIKSIMNNVNFCKKINPNSATFNVVSPIPGTSLYDYCVENDLLLTKNWDLYSYYHQIIKLYSIPDYQIENLQKVIYKIFKYYEGNKKIFIK